MIIWWKLELDFLGAVNLYGKSLQERARLLISIAHPDDREMLDRAAFERYGQHWGIMRA